MNLFEVSFFSFGDVALLNQKSKYRCDEEISKSIRDFACSHQGEFIQYSFLASEFHRKFKEEHNSESPDQAKLIQYKEDLIKHLNERFATIVQDSFEHMQKFFNGRHKKSPRICLKANYETGPQKKVITLFREKRNSVGYDSDCAVRENTGFLWTKQNGTYYLCQDICAEAKKGNYRNPRLQKPAVDNYVEDSWWQRKKNINANGFYKDTSWQKCWKAQVSDGESVLPHYRNCYKSTLIIPLTLRNNTLSAEFIRGFNMEDMERTIFGYLCFDHIEKNYFDPIVDVDFGYVYADLLSLYLLARFTYTARSRTFQDFVLQSGT